MLRIRECPTVGAPFRSCEDNGKRGVATVKAEDGGIFTVGHSSNHNRFIHFNTTNMNLRWRTGKWSSYMMGVFVKGTSADTDSSESTFHNSGNMLSTVSDRKSTSPGTVNSTVGVGYDFDDRNLVTLEGAFRSRRNSSRLVTETGQWLSGVSDFEQTASGLSGGKNDAKILNLSFNYTHLFNERSSLVFKADRLQNEGNDNQSNEYLYHNGDSTRYGSRNDEKNLVYTASVDWEKTFAGKDKLMAGLKYTDLFPEVAIHYDINKEKGHRAALQYNRSIGRPSMRSLNPLIVRVSEYSYSTGNPLLKPSYWNRLTSRLTLFDSYLLSITYSSSKNGSFSPGSVDPGSDIIFTRSENGFQSRNLEIYTEYPFRFGSWGQLKLYGSYSLHKQQFKDDKADNSSWDAGFSGMFNLPYGIGVMADLRYSPPQRTLYRKTHSLVYSNVVINKSFLNRKLATSLMFGDIFNMIGGQRSDYFYNDYTMRQRGLSSTSTVLVRINYTLNWGNQSAKIRRGSAGNTSEQGRISSEN